MKLKSVQLHQGVNFYLNKYGISGVGVITSLESDHLSYTCDIELPSPESTVLLVRFYKDKARKDELLRTFVSLAMVHSGIFLPNDVKETAKK